MAIPTDISRFLESLGTHYARFYTDQVQEMFVAYVQGDRAKVSAAREKLAQVIADTMGVAELMGASAVLRTVAGVLAPGQRLAAERGHMQIFADQSLIPSVTFEEALEEILTRTPVTIRNAAQRSALSIAKLYSKDRVMAFAYSAEQAVTERAQSFIAQALREGIGEGEAGRRLAMSVNEIRAKSELWSEAYSRMAFRTNVNTAVTAGRFRQARDEDIKEVTPAFRFDAVGDADTRDSHGNLDGTILKVDNPAWNDIAPPLGYNCRCQVTLMSRPMLRRANALNPDGSVKESVVPANAGADPGFRHGGRPDLMLG